MAKRKRLIILFSERKEFLLMSEEKVVAESSQVITTYLIPIVIGLGSGVVGSLIGAFNSSRIEKVRIKIKSLEDQLKHFYGPMMYYVVENDEIFSFTKRLIDEYKKAGKEGTLSKEDGDSIFEEEKKMINNIVVKNNEKIIDFIETNFNYIDVEDITLLSRFLLDYRRLKLEFDNNDKLKIPLEVHIRLGKISFMSPEFIKNFKSKFEIKKNKLFKLYKRTKKPKCYFEQLKTFIRAKFIEWTTIK